MRVEVLCVWCDGAGTRAVDEPGVLHWFSVTCLDILRPEVLKQRRGVDRKMRLVRLHGLPTVRFHCFSS